MEDVEFEKLSLKEDDILVMHVDVGDLPKHMAESKSFKKMEEVKKELKEAGKENRVICFTKNKGQGSNVEVLPVKEGDKLVFNIAVGNMPKAMAEAYIQKLAKQYRQNVITENDSIWFAKYNDGQCNEVLIEEKK